MGIRSAASIRIIRRATVAIEAPATGTEISVVPVGIDLADAAVVDFLYHALFDEPDYVAEVVDSVMTMGRDGEASINSVKISAAERRRIWNDLRRLPLCHKQHGREGARGEGERYGFSLNHRDGIAVIRPRATQDSLSFVFFSGAVGAQGKTTNPGIALTLDVKESGGSELRYYLGERGDDTRVNQLARIVLHTLLSPDGISRLAALAIDS
jgi:hypothetical protein